MKRLFLFVIAVYQRTLSLDHGILGRIVPVRFCRFYPSCSEYTRQSILRFGIFGGVWRGVRRFVRCHPWNPGGYDPVPEKDIWQEESVRKQSSGTIFSKKKRIGMYF